MCLKIFVFFLKNVRNFLSNCPGTTFPGSQLLHVCSPPPRPHLLPLSHYKNNNINDDNNNKISLMGCETFDINLVIKVIKTCGRS